jgi:acetylglutamate kinase
MANKTKLVQLFRFQLKCDYWVLQLKLCLFDRLSQILIVLIRRQLKNHAEIAAVSTGYLTPNQQFRFIDSDQTANEIAIKLSAIKFHIAEA